MSISSCPRCSQQVTLPVGVSNSARVRCPLCHAQYVLADALVNMPPLLEVIEDSTDESSLDWLDEAPRASAAAGIALPEDAAPPDEELLSFDEAAPLADESLPLEEAPSDEVLRFDAVELEEEESLEIQEQDTEVEELPLIVGGDVREVPADDEPIEVGSAEEEPDFLQFEAPQAEGELPEFTSDEPAGTVEELEEVPLDFGEPTAQAPAGGEEELSFDFEPVASGPADTGAIDFGEPVVVPSADDEPIELDFGEANAETTPTFNLEEPSASAKGKKGKEKKKKAEKVKTPKAQKPAGERSLVTTLVSVLVPTVIAIPLALYGALWLSPDYDLLGFGKLLPKFMLPASFSKTRTIAKIPPVSAPPQQLPETETPAEQPASGEQPPAEPAAAAPSDNVTPASAETPAPAAESVAAPATDAPAEPAPAADTPAAPAAPSEPAAPLAGDATSSAPAPSDTAATEPAAPAAEPTPPAEEKPAVEDSSLDALLDAPAEPDAPAEMPVDADAKPSLEDAIDAPAEEMPAEELPADEPATKADADTPFDAIDDAKPAEEAMELGADEEVGLRNPRPATPEDVVKAATDYLAADKRLAAAIGSGDKAEVKKARAGFFLSLYNFADTFSLVNRAPLDAQPPDFQQGLRELASNPERVKELGSYAAKWLAFGKRTTPGIVLAGTVESVDQMGKLFEVKVKLTDDAPSAAIVTRDDPRVEAGDQVIVLGTIVDNPTEELVGYEGTEPTAVWSGVTFKAPAAEK